jgi:hypothetical protein
VWFTKYIGNELSERMFIRIFWHETIPQSPKSSPIAVNGYDKFSPVNKLRKEKQKKSADCAIWHRGLHGFSRQNFLINR